MKSDIWMPWYPGDYQRDTQHLTTLEHGAYRLLIDACWCRGGNLPSDDGDLARIVHLQPQEWLEIRPRIAAFFNTDNGYWTHKRVSLELELAKSNSERNKARTAAATNARLQRSENVTKNVTKNVTFTPSPSPSPSPSPVQHTHPSVQVTSLVEKSLTTNGESVCVIPLQKQKAAFEIDARFKWLEVQLCALYKRPRKNVGRGEEEHLVADVALRPDVKTELRELIEAREEIGERYFPQSLAVLCRDWDKTLDRARNHAPAPKPFRDKSILEKESDRLCQQILNEP